MGICDVREGHRKVQRGPAPTPVLHTVPWPCHAVADPVMDLQEGNLGSWVLTLCVRNSDQRQWLLAGAVCKQTDVQGSDR